MTPTEIKLILIDKVVNHVRNMTELEKLETVRVLLKAGLNYED